MVGDESAGDADPLLAKLLAAAASGAPPAGWAHKRKPIRMVLDPDDQPVANGTLCAANKGFNLHAATRVAIPRDFGTDTPPAAPSRFALATAAMRNCRGSGSIGLVQTGGFAFTKPTKKTPRDHG